MKIYSQFFSILIANIKTRNISACNSGLKELKNNMISKKLEGTESKKNNLIIALEPSIKVDNY